MQERPLQRAALQPVLLSLSSLTFRCSFRAETHFLVQLAAEALALRRGPPMRQVFEKYSPDEYRRCHSTDLLGEKM
jgi:hypothetical protein